MLLRFYILFPLQAYNPPIPRFLPSLSPPPALFLQEFFLNMNVRTVYGISFARYSL